MINGQSLRFRGNKHVCYSCEEYVIVIVDWSHGKISNG